MSLAVIIPFYQKEAGILAGALRSVVAQTWRTPMHVVVVDDESPVSALHELATVALRDGVTVEVISQPNGGPAAARNRGLSALAADVTRVAFLDSDDAWDEAHIARAVEALDAGYDFYFSDHYQLGQSVGAFARGGRVDAAAHPTLGDSPYLRRYVGDMFDQIVTGNLIGTSTVVYDLVRLRTLRFDEALYSAGEDYLFWIACARAGARFCFSTAIEVRYGHGVNVYAGSTWGTEGHLGRIYNETRYRKRLLDFELTHAQREFVRGRLARLREDFANDLLHRVTHRRPIPIEIVKAQALLDPVTLLTVPIHAGQLVARRVRQRK